MHTHIGIHHGTSELMLALGFINVLLKLLIKFLLVRQNIIGRGEGWMPVAWWWVSCRVSWVGTGRVAIPPSSWRFQCPNKHAFWLGIVKIGDQINQSGVNLSFEQSSDVVGVDWWPQQCKIHSWKHLNSSSFLVQGTASLRGEYLGFPCWFFLLVEVNQVLGLDLEDSKVVPMTELSRQRGDVLEL